MASLEAPWTRWCRICANQNTENSYYIQFEGIVDQDATNILELKFTAKKALEIFLGVKPNEAMPRFVCKNCYKRLSDMMLFQEHCVKVQQMFSYLHRNPVQGTRDLRAIRITANLEKFANDLHYRESEKAKNVKSDSNEELILEATNVVALDDVSDTMSEHLIWKDDEKKLGSNISEAGEPQSALPEISSKENNLQNVEQKYFCEDFVLDVTCPLCKEKFNYYYSYCKHMKSSHSNANLFENYCPLCKRSFLTSFHLGKHMRVHMPLETRFPFKCDVCDSRHSTAEQLKEHFTLKHKKEKHVKCPLCNFCGVTRAVVKTHMNIHSNKEPYECHICKKRFKVLRRLNFHLETHAEEKYERTVSGIKQNSSTTLKKHSLVHTEKKLHKCDYCSSFFKRSKSLKGHLLMHSGLKLPCICNFCDLRYSNRQQCREHMSKEHPQEYASMVESSNKKLPRSVPTLKKLKEVRKSSKNLKPLRPNARRPAKKNFECQYCKCPYSYYWRLKVHVKNKHPGELKDFLKMSSVGKHAYICNFCDHPYSNRQQCLEHMSKEHPQEHTAMVESSNKVLTRSLRSLDKLKILRKSSKNLMPLCPNGKRTTKTKFQCPYCKCPYSYYWRLMIHVKNKHPGEFKDFLKM